MIQTDQQNSPKLRFPEFQEPWLPQKVGAFIFEHREKSTAKDQHQVLTSSRKGLQLQSEYFGENRLTERDNTGFNIIPPEHITYRSRSDNREFYFNENNLGITGIISVYYPVFRIVDGSNRFFTTLLNFKRHLVGRYSVGTSQTVLSLNDLRSIRLPIPCKDEQCKIARFLGSVDTKIAQLAEKKRLLEDYKKGCMQQLFSQKVRFKDDTGNDFPDWKEKRLGSLGHFTGGGTPDTNVYAYWEGDIPWVSSSDLSEGLIQHLKISRQITKDAVQESATQITPKGAILIVTRVGIGKCAIAPKDLCTSQDFTNFVPDEGNAEFFAHWLVHNQRKLQSLAQGTSIKGVTTKDLKALKLDYPHPDEQSKIADFLSALDRKIDLIGQELTCARSFKRGLLQQMLV